MNLFGLNSSKSKVKNFMLPIAVLLSQTSKLPPIVFPSQYEPRVCAVVKLNNKAKNLPGTAWGQGTGWSVYTYYSDGEELEILGDSAHYGVYVRRLRAPELGEYTVDPDQLRVVVCRSLSES
jgi:hypothetical protein